MPKDATHAKKRTMEYLRGQGYKVADVERYNSFAKKRFDMFGCIDLVCLQGKAIVGIQCTSGVNHATHLNDCLTNKPDLPDWLAGGHFEIWSWSKRVRHNQDGSKSLRPEWRPRVQQIIRKEDGTLMALAAHNPKLNGEVS